MDTSTDNDTSKYVSGVELSDDNYDLWARRTQAILEAKGVWWTVESTPEEPTVLDDRAYLVGIGYKPQLPIYKMKWQDDGRRAISLMLSYTDSTRWEYLQNASVGKTPAQLWKFLRETYEHTDANAQMILLDQLVKLNLSTNATHEETKSTFDTFQRLVERMLRNKTSVEDIFKVLAFRLCADKFTSIVNVVALDKNTTIQSTLRACIMASSRREAASSTIKALVTSAKITKDRGKKQDQDRRRNTDKKSGRRSGNGRHHNTNNTESNGPKPKCDHCEKAHETDDCWKKYPNKRPEWLVEKQKRRKMGLGEKNSE